MAIEPGELAAALRITDGSEPPEPQRTILRRLAKVANEMIERTAPDAPAMIKQQACIQLAGYLYDQPTAGVGTRYAAAFRNSGALSLLSKWIEKRAGVRAEQ